MGNVRTDPLKRVSFYCKPCRHKWQAEPDTVQDAPDRPWHPWFYFANCPNCGDEAEQAGWEKGLMATFGRHTGPRTPEGLSAVTANLEGHPTAEESRRTRFNAMKHGLFAQTATYYPAKPGKYPHCTGCEHLETWACYDTGACLKRTELLLQHQIAFETGDPRMLNDLRARTQAMVQAIIDDIILAIISEGVQLKTPAWYYDKDGVFHLAEYYDSEGERRMIYEINAHPLLKTLGDFLSKNSMTLADLNMTPKQVTEEKQMQGYLDGQNPQKDTALDYQRRQTHALEQLKDQISRSQSRIARDPVLIEHQQSGDGDG